MSRFSIVKSVDQVDKHAWDDFANSEPSAMVFHSRPFIEFMSTAGNHKVQSTFVLEGQKVVGAYFRIGYGSGNPLLKMVTGRAVSYGGPLVAGQNAEVLTLLLENAKDPGAIYTEVRLFTDLSWGRAQFEASGFEYKAHLNVLVDVKEETKMWEALKSSKRNKIRKSIKGGVEVVVKQDLSDQELGRCHEILSGLYTRIQLPLPEVGFFQNLMRSELGASTYFTLALHEGQIIAFRLHMLFNDRVFDWYAADDPVHRKLSVNDRTVWETLVWSGKHSAKLFDFGGAGKPGDEYGVRDFKIQFGGEVVEFGRFQRVNRPLSMKLATKGLEVVKKMGIIKKFS